MTRTILLNRPRANFFMANAGLDAIVAASPANVQYLSGYNCWIEPLLCEWMVRPGGTSNRVQESFAVITRPEGAGLLIASGVAPDALDSWTSSVCLFGSFMHDDAGEPNRLPPELARLHEAQLHPVGDSAASGLAQMLDDLGLADGKVGIDVDGMEPRTAEHLRAALPRAGFCDSSNLFRLVRMVKTQPEIELLKLAAEVNERSAVMALRAARPGDSVAQLSAQFKQAVTAEGAVYDHFASGLGGIGGSSNTSYMLREGETLCVDYGCLMGGYYSDAGVTLALGELSPQLIRRYEALRAAILDVGLGAVRPGAASSSIHRAMADYLGRRGITECFPHGHGLGLEIRDYPILVPDTRLRIADGAVDVAADLLLEPGMVINLEVSLFIPGTASLEVEITIVVTETGARPLIDQERSSPIRARSTNPLRLNVTASL